MNSANYVDQLIVQMKSDGIPLSDAAWKAALACVGWPYVFGARGEYCTPENRRKRYSDEHPTIKTKCKNFDGSGSCSGCKWYPNGQRVRFFDCRGFTYWILLQVYGWKLMGAGATSQWNNEDNWSAKGTIDAMPADTLCCLFVQKGKTMEHTGFGLNNETVECSNGVQHFTTRNKKWTHWAVPKCVEGGSEPVEPTKPTLRKGSSGEYVTLLQTILIQHGYSCGRYGADGKFGNDTLSAVKAFQRDHALEMDGVVGPRTWEALSNPDSIKTYTVHIPLQPMYKAELLLNQYAGAWMTEEDGGVSGGHE